MGEQLWNCDKEMKYPLGIWGQEEKSNQMFGGKIMFKKKKNQEGKFSTYEEKQQSTIKQTLKCVFIFLYGGAQCMCMAPVGRSLGSGTPPGSRWYCEEGAYVRTLWGTVVLPVIRTSLAGLNIVEKEKFSRGDFKHLLPGFIQMYQQIQSG